MRSDALLYKESTPLKLSEAERLDYAALIPPVTQLTSTYSRKTRRERAEDTRKFERPEIGLTLRTGHMGDTCGEPAGSVGAKEFQTVALANP